MKQWKFLGAAAAAMMMLSSCLGDTGGQTSSFSNLLGGFQNTCECCPDSSRCGR